jgi:hypothetical protein
MENVQGKKVYEQKVYLSIRYVRQFRIGVVEVSVFICKIILLYVPCSPQYYGDKCQFHSNHLTVLFHSDLSQSIYVESNNPIMVINLLIIFLYEDQPLLTRYGRPPSKKKSSKIEFFACKLAFYLKDEKTWFSDYH